MARTVSVALVQHSCTDDRERNLAKSEAGIREAHRQGAQLIVLPELHASVYFPKVQDYRYFDLAESIPGPTTERFVSLARELGVVLVLSLFEKRGAGLFHNTAVVLEKDGSIAGQYRKTHIPDDPGFFEKFYFTPGDLGIHPIKTSVGVLGLLVCWDQWYPEAARLMALAGAEMLIYPTAIGCNSSFPEDLRAHWAEAWTLVQRGHAVANCLPVLAPNRFGLEKDASGQGDEVIFWGRSFIAGGQGELLARASEDREEVLLATLDLERNEQLRRDWHFFRDRRIDLYGDLARRYRD